MKSGCDEARCVAHGLAGRTNEQVDKLHLALRCNREDIDERKNLAAQLPNPICFMKSWLSQYSHS